MRVSFTPATVAVLLMLPSCGASDVTVSVISSDALAPASSTGKVHVPAETDPAAGEIVSTVAPTGSDWLRSTNNPDASDGPLFVAVMV